MPSLGFVQLTLSQPVFWRAVAGNWWERMLRTGLSLQVFPWGQIHSLTWHAFCLRAEAQSTTRPDCLQVDEIRMDRACFAPLWQSISTTLDLGHEVVITLVGGEESRSVGGRPFFTESVKVRGICTFFNTQKPDTWLLQVADCAFWVEKRATLSCCRWETGNLGDSPKDTHPLRNWIKEPRNLDF